MKKIKIQDFEVNFLKKTSQKTIRLRINSKGEVILSAPFFCSEKKAVSFAMENINWIKTHLENQVKSQQFENGATISILGVPCQIMLVPNQEKKTFLENGILYVPGKEEHLHRRVKEFICYTLLSYIQKEAPRMAEKINQKPAKIALRDTSSRWGSCSCNKTLHFCWKIALAPLFVIDYLIAHEVAHLKEMNHGIHFWETVALFNTERAKAEIWLRKNGNHLQSYK